MKTILKGLVLALAWAALTVPVCAQIADRIVAIVNEDVITLSELNAAFEPYAARINATYRGGDKAKVMAEGRTAILNRMIDNKLIEQQSKQSGLTVKDDEAMNVIRGMLASKKMELDEFVKVLERDGSSLDAHRKEIKDQLLRQRLIRREIQSKIVVSDEEVGAYYKKHQDEYEGKEAVRVRMILLATSQGTERDALRRQAGELRARLLKGEPFEMLAAQYSQGPTAPTGGDIGYIERGQTLPELEEAAFRMAVGEISPVIELAQGLYLLKVVDKRGGGLKPFAEVRQEIIMKIEDEKMGQRFDVWIADLRKKSHVVIKL